MELVIFVRFPYFCKLIGFCFLMFSFTVQVNLSLSRIPLFSTSCYARATVSTFGNNVYRKFSPVGYSTWHAVQCDHRYKLTLNSRAKTDQSVHCVTMRRTSFTIRVRGPSLTRPRLGRRDLSFHNALMSHIPNAAIPQSASHQFQS